MRLPIKENDGWVKKVIFAGTDPPQALSDWGGGGNIFQNRAPLKAFVTTSFRKRSRL